MVMLDLRDAPLHSPGTSDPITVCHTNKSGDPTLAVQSAPLQPGSKLKGFYQGTSRGIVAHLHLQGLSSIPYLGDLLVYAHSLQPLRADLEKLIFTLETLGWIVNREKSSLAPSQTKVFLRSHALRGLNALSFRRESCKGDGGSFNITRAQRMFLQAHHEGLGADDVLHPSPSLGTASLQRTSVLSALLVRQEEGVLGWKGVPSRRNKSLIKVVTRWKQARVKSTLGTVVPSQADRRCKFLGMGGPIWRTPGLRELGTQHRQKPLPTTENYWWWDGP